MMIRKPTLALALSMGAVIATGAVAADRKRDALARRIPSYEALFAPAK